MLLFLVAAAVLVWVRSTRFGRNLYAIGGNRDAAVLVGIPVLRMELLVYALAGMFAALAGIMYASRMDAAQPAVGEGWLMKAITAAILGGTSLKGGQGTILGTVFGTLLTVLANGLSLMNVSAYWARESSSVPLCSLRYSETFCATELKLERDLPMTNNTVSLSTSQAAATPSAFSLPEKSKALGLYESMVLLRKYEERIYFLFLEGRISAASINRTGRRLVPSACYTIRGRRTTWPRRIGLRVTIWPRGYRSIR